VNWAESTRDTRVDHPHHTPEPHAVQDRHGIHSGCHYTLTLLPVQAQTVAVGVYKVTHQNREPFSGQISATT